MKKVMLSMLVMFGLIGAANASVFVDTHAVTGAKFTIPFVAVPVLAMYAASQVKLPACASEPSRLGKHASGSNYSFAVSACDYKANPSAYKFN